MSAFPWPWPQPLVWKAEKPSNGNCWTGASCIWSGPTSNPRPPAVAPPKPAHNAHFSPPQAVRDNFAPLATHRRAPSPLAALLLGQALGNGNGTFDSPVSYLTGPST